MSKRNFMSLLKAKWDEGKFVCVGLDSDPAKIPVSLETGLTSNTIAKFNLEIVKATKDLVCAFKPNVAFYEDLGIEGLLALHQTIDDIHSFAPDVPVILDYKRADIGNTNGGYIRSAFDRYGADAVTINPYLGQEAMQPFLDQTDKGIFVLCRTSNPGAGEFQDLQVPWYRGINIGTQPLYQSVARNVTDKWNGNDNCALVVGATYPEELAQVRNIVGDMPILIPGIGAQGGDLEATVKAGKNSHNKGMIINSSRGIIFASSGDDFAEAARRETQKLHDAIAAAMG